MSVIADEPLVSVIVPTYNSSENVKNFLESFLDSAYKNIEIIVNDDPRTNDSTEAITKEYICRGLKIIYKKENISMAQGRKRGVDFSSGEILLHLDSDMKVTKGLIRECVDETASRFDALVIPEESFGTTFWAKCKWLEKKCYEGIEQIESIRCIKRGVYISLGGHDEAMVFSEDKDLDIRVRRAGYKIGRVKNFLWHNEGNLSLLKTLRKKLHYTNTANTFKQKHPKEFRWQVNLMNRYFVYLRKIQYLFQYPLLYVGMFFMKTCEFGFGGVGYVLQKLQMHKKFFRK